jgi:hypothetical protein
LIGGWNPLSVSLGTRILILNSIGEQIIFDFHWFMKDEEATDLKEGFSQLPLDEENKLKEGSWEAWGGKNYLVCFPWEEKENECVRG